MVLSVDLEFANPIEKEFVLYPFLIHNLIEDTKTIVFCCCSQSQPLVGVNVVQYGKYSWSLSQRTTYIIIYPNCLNLIHHKSSLEHSRLL